MNNILIFTVAEHLHLERTFLYIFSMCACTYTLHMLCRMYNATLIVFHEFVNDSSPSSEAISSANVFH